VAYNLPNWEHRTPIWLIEVVLGIDFKNSLISGSAPLHTGLLLLLTTKKACPNSGQTRDLFVV
jgi:hypothetical protein